MSNLYQDAILDAKALRASAMANAKAALEEAFEPKIQEMIAKHLSEEEEAGMEEGYGKEEEGYEKHEEGKMHDGEVSEDINEAELEEILNQLEEMSEPKEESLNEAEEDEADEEEDEEGEEAEEVTDETKVIEITVGDLKEILKSVMPGQELPAAEPRGPEAEKEEEVSLEEILDELSLEEDSLADDVHEVAGIAEDTLPGDIEEEGLNENSWTTNARGEQIIPKNPKKPKTRHELDKEFGPVSGPSNTRREGVVNEDAAVYQQLVDFIQSLSGQISPEGAENLLTALSSMAGGGAVIAALRKIFPGVKDTMDKTSAVGPAPKGLTKEVEELKEAKATIEKLRKDLQEVNLLNAKYLYMNKLFKGKSLTESQKLKVVNALDRATSVKEVKNTYETLKESFETKKGQLKESTGFASKPAGVAPKANIVEADQFVSRWQKLAGIK